MTVDWTKGRRRCPHCNEAATRAVCVTCNRELCDSCISMGAAGYVCGLCKDREDGYVRWKASGSPLEFDEWYDQNA